MTNREIGIILNGATGGICSFQHLANSLVPIRAEGGLRIGDETIMPKLLLVGRDDKRLSEIARAHGLDAWTTELDTALNDLDYPVFFDAAATHTRADILHRALAAGKHIYAEKPVAMSVEGGLALLREAESRGLKHGVVEDKLRLPGLRKLAKLVDHGFFGRIVGFSQSFRHRENPLFFPLPRRETLFNQPDNDFAHAGVIAPREPFHSAGKLGSQRDACANRFG